VQTPLNAAASSAGALLSTSTFDVPPFQREYSWQEDEIADFWNDLSGSIEADSYFLAIEAFKHYHRAEEEGYNPIYVNFNKAMACCVEGEYKGCRNYLSFIDPFPGTYLEFNCTVLRFVSMVLEGNKPDVKVKDISTLKRGLEESKRAYSVQQGPLRYLFQALLKRGDGAVDARLTPLLKVLDLRE
jgi:hypothetical protein